MRFPIFILSSLSLITFSAFASAKKDLTETERKTIWSLVNADKSETIWKDKINWHADIWEARKIANREGKPLLIWEMDGHPMGCT